MFVPISHKLINPLSQNPIRPLAILIHNSFPSMEMKYMGKCYYFHKHLHIYGGGCKQAGAWGLFLWRSSFLATLLFGEDDTMATSSPFSHKGEICSLFFLYQSFSIPGLPHTSKMPEIYSKTPSEIIREETVVFEGWYQTDWTPRGS